SPRPETIQASGDAVCSTRKLTSVSNSVNKRSSIFLDVKYFPSLPANGLLLTRKVICNGGSSILSNGKASTSSSGQTVSPTIISSIPVTATMSPAFASLTSIRSSPTKPNNFVTRNFFSIPSVLTSTTRCPTEIVPQKTLPTPICPK